MFRLFSYLCFLLNGWKLNADIITKNKLTKAIVIAAPHTSNWDLVYLTASFIKLKKPLRFTIKKFWMKFPFNLIIKPLGGMAVDRSKSTNFVQGVANLMKENNIFMAFTPEGTRQKSDDWKLGFYYAAIEANVPILLGYLDYDKKEAGIGKIIHPSGDAEKDMKEISEFYETISPLYPENFSINK